MLESKLTPDKSHKRTKEFLTSDRRDGVSLIWKDAGRLGMGNWVLQLIQFVEFANFGTSVLPTVLWNSLFLIPITCIRPIPFYHGRILLNSFTYIYRLKIIYIHLLSGTPFQWGITYPKQPDSHASQMLPVPWNTSPDSQPLTPRYPLHHPIPS